MTSKNRFVTSSFFLKSVISFLIFAGPLFCHAQLSGSYTINPNQTGSATNYISMDDALGDLLNGSRSYSGTKINGPGISGPVVFSISDGSYFETETFTSIKGASAKNTISFISASGDSSKVILSSYSYPVITLDGARYIYFKELSFFTHSSSFIFLQNGASHNSFKGCNFSGTSSNMTANMIYATDADTANIFDHNYFKNFANGIYGDLVYTNGMYSTIISNNVFDSGSAHAIYLKSSYGVAITNNRINMPVSGGNGIYLYSETGPLLITDNFINSDYGILIYGAINNGGKPVGISNNMIVAVSEGLVVSKYSSYNISYNTIAIYNNTRYAYNTAGLAIQGDSISIENNNIANFGNGPAISMASGGTDITCDYNNIFVPDSAIGTWNNKNEKNLASWTKATGFDTHSISVNPYFLNNTDGHAFNPLLKAGIPISGINTDIDNNTRNKTTPCIGANEFAVFSSDAGINRVDSLESSYCKGATAKVYARLVNYGTNTLTSTIINWSINGAIQTAYSWSGSLASGKTASVNLGSITFAKTGIIKCWTTNFNGSTDQDHQNDTSGAYIQVKMTGSYTIGGSGADFSGFNDAAAELLRSGLCGPVVISVNNGIYREQVMLPMIQGANSTNTITFESTSGDSAKAVLEYPSSSDNTAPNYTLEINQGKYYFIHELGFKRTGNDTNAAVLVVSTGSDSNSFSGNMFIGNQANPVRMQNFYKNNAVDLQASSGNAFNGNLIRNGSNGIFIGYAYSAPGGYLRNQFTSNIIDSSFYTGFYGTGPNILFSNNLVTNIWSSAANGLWFSADSMNVENNRIFLPNGGNGIYITLAGTGYFGTSVSDGNVYNNFITVNANPYFQPSNGIYCFTNQQAASNSYPYSINLYNNSINITGIDSFSCGIFIKDQLQPTTRTTAYIYNNNILNSAKGYLVSNQSTTKLYSDFNNVLTNGSTFGTLGSVIGPVLYKTLKDWTKITKTDSNSISLISWFPSTTDLHARNPLLAGTGKALSKVVTDIDGKLRNKKPAIGANEINPIPYDAGVGVIVAPILNFCSGSHDFQVSLRNYGTTTLKTDSIIWQLYGARQKSYFFSGSIAPGDSVVIDLGNSSLSGSTSNDWFISKYPNAHADLNPANDSAHVHFNASMHGTYTIGGVTPDFTSITQAVNTMYISKICGPVVFNIRNGIYNEQVSIPNITGASSVNTITFQAESGDSSKVIVSYPSSTNATAPNYVLSLDSAANTFIRHISFIRTGTNPKSGVIELTHNPTADLLTGCRIIGSKSRTNISDSAALIFHNYGYSFDVVFKNNLLKYGSYCYVSWQLQNYNGWHAGSGTDSMIHNTIDSCITGIAGNIYVGYNHITNFVHYAVSAGYTIGNWIYSPINLDEALIFCDSVINNIISTSAPTALSECYNIFYNNIELFLNNPICSNITAMDESDVVKPLIKNNNILFMSTIPNPMYNGPLCNVYLTYTPYTTDYSTSYDSTSVNNNNGFTELSNMNVEFQNMQSTSYHQIGEEFANSDGLSSWGSPYDQDIRGGYPEGLPDKHSVSLDPMVASYNYPEISNFNLAHKGTPIPGITTDINGNLRDTLRPSIGAEEIKGLANNAATVYVLPTQTCGDTAYHISVIVQNRGGSQQAAIPVVAEISSGKFYMKISDTIYKTIKPYSAFDTFTFKTPAYLYQSGTYHIKAYTALPGDQNKTDDTARSSLLIVGNKKPAEKKISICTPGPVRLTLDNINASDTIKWYKTPNDITPLSTKDTFTTGTISKDSVLYISSAGPQIFHLPDLDTTGALSQYSPGNLYFAVSVARPCFVDSVTIYPQHSGSLHFSLGYYDTSSAPFHPQYIYSNYHTIKVTVTSPYQPFRIGLHIPLRVFNDIKFMFDSITTGNLLYRELTGSQYRLPPMALPGILSYDGDSSVLGYGGCYSPYGQGLFNWTFSTSCPADKFPYKIYVGGKPTFSLDKDPASQAIYNAGTLQDPDLICLQNTDIYRVFTAYPDADYGSAWKIKSFYFESLAGDSAKNASLVLPSGSGIGQVIFNPQTYLSTDSIFKINMTIGSPAGIGCDTTITRYIRVVPLPIAKFSAPNGCIGQQVYFSASGTGSGNLSYLWNFGDSANSNQKNALHSYTKSGLYSVVLKLTNTGGCTDSVVQKINILSKPVSIFSADSAVCLGGTIHFKDLSNHNAGDTGTWYFGDGLKDTGSKVQHIYANPGRYRASLVIKNMAGCQDTGTKSVVIYPNPKATFSANNVCLEDSVSFINTSSIISVKASYSWLFDDTTSSKVQSPLHLFKYAGTHTAKLFVRDTTGCPDSISKSVEVYPLPSPVFGFIQTNRQNIKFLAADTSYNFYKWQFGDASSDSSGYRIVHAYANPGTYSASLKVNDMNGCTNSSLNSVLVKPSGIEPIVQDIKLNVYPNPFTNDLMINYELNSESDVQYEIHDIAGKLVMHSKNLRQMPGIYTKTIKTGNLSEGVYNLRLTINGQVINKNVVHIIQE